jgi:hypothetical protein
MLAVVQAAHVPHAVPARASGCATKVASVARLCSAAAASRPRCGNRERLSVQRRRPTASSVAGSGQAIRVETPGDPNSSLPSAAVKWVAKRLHPSAARRAPVRKLQAWHVSGQELNATQRGQRPGGVVQREWLASRRFARGNDRRAACETAPASKCGASSLNAVRSHVCRRRLKHVMALLVRDGIVTIVCESGPVLELPANCRVHGPVRIGRTAFRHLTNRRQGSPLQRSSRVARTK